MDNEANIVSRLPSRHPFEVASYTVIIAVAFGCVGMLFAAWVAIAGLCEWWVPIMVGATMAAIAFLVAAIWLVRDRNELLWAVEEVVGDLDGDGIRGNPEQQDKGKPTLPAPSGNRVLVSDLLTFAKLAPDDKIGTSFQGFWSDRWPHEYWQDVMDIWAAHRCVEPRRERHKSKWLAKSYDQAAARLFGTYANRPTP